MEVHLSTHRDPLSILDWSHWEGTYLIGRWFSKSSFIYTQEARRSCVLARETPYG